MVHAGVHTYIGLVHFYYTYLPACNSSLGKLPKSNAVPRRWLPRRLQTAIIYLLNYDYIIGFVKLKKINGYSIVYFSAFKNQMTYLIV